MDLALQHHAAGRLSEAEGVCQQMLQADPDHPFTLHLLGVISHQTGKSGQAVDLITRALSINPDNADAHNSLGNVLKDLGELDQAVDSYQKALTLKPDYVVAHYNLANALKELGKLDEAMSSYHKALALKPDYAEAHNNLGIALQDLGRLDEAAASYHRALAINPDYPEAHNNLGNALQDLGKPDEALAGYHKALAIKPDFADAHSNLIFIQDLISNIDQNAQQAERKRWNDTFILPLAAKTEPHTNLRDPDRRLRIGYVSADFRRHSACQGFAPLILDFDRSRFDVICYDATLVADRTSQTLRAAASAWRSIRGISDEVLARTIREDKIDILVDLSGHSRGNRLTVFGDKPAPLQVTGVGHAPPGLSTMDYRLTTVFATPPEEESIFPEAPIYLDTFFGFMPPPDTPPVTPPPCLESGTITFGSLNRLSKVSNDVMAQWAMILHQVSEARLLIKAPQMGEVDVRQSVETFFSERGIDQDRLILLGGTPQRQHLEAYGRIDIALDTFPAGGGITTLESLWMGVPVVGLNDSLKFSNRQIEFTCRPLGLGEWISRATDEYRAIALQWADRGQDLSKIRQQLRQRISEVYFRFPRDVEKAYRLIWKRWCDGDAASTLYPLT